MEGARIASNTITGTDLADTLTGTCLDDAILGLSAGDSLYGASGNDSLYGATQIQVDSNDIDFCVTGITAANQLTADDFLWL